MRGAILILFVCFLSNKPEFYLLVATSNLTESVNHVNGLCLDYTTHLYKEMYMLL